MNYSVFCLRCGRNHDPSEPRWKCDCGGLLQIRMNSSFHIEKNSTFSIFSRYRNMLPLLDASQMVFFHEYQTPLTSYEKNILCKSDFLFATGSFKDRGAAVLISKMKEWGIEEIVEDSSGNAGCAIAAYAAKANIACNILIPEKTSARKIKQLKSYQTKIHQIRGNREKTAQKALEIARTMMYASHVWQPYFMHGTKTIAYEIWEQCGADLPKKIYVPVGNGTLLLGLALGFEELKRAGVIQRIPSLIAVQSEKCAPLYPKLIRNEIDSSIAPGIRIANPLRYTEMKQAIRKTNGCVVTVSDEAILSAKEELGRKGWFVETTAAVALAGIRKNKEKELVLMILTGSGLKE